MWYRECTCWYNNLCASQKKVLENGKLKEVWWIRVSDTGATRDTGNWKLEYNKYINPLCDYNFSMYMRSKQIIWWEYRDWDNRQKWLWSNSLFDSLCRHIEILKLLMKWHRVFEYKDWDKIQLVVDPIEISMWWEEKQIITELNACRFNSEWMKLELLLGRDEWIRKENCNIYSDYLL